MCQTKYPKAYLKIPKLFFYIFEKVFDCVQIRLKQSIVVMIPKTLMFFMTLIYMLWAPFVRQRLVGEQM